MREIIHGDIVRLKKCYLYKPASDIEIPIFKNRDYEILDMDSDGYFVKEVNGKAMAYIDYEFAAENIYLKGGI